MKIESYQVKMSNVNLFLLGYTRFYCNLYCKIPSALCKRPIGIKHFDNRH